MTRAETTGSLAVRALLRHPGPSSRPGVVRETGIVVWEYCSTEQPERETTSGLMWGARRGEGGGAADVAAKWGLQLTNENKKKDKAPGDNTRPGMLAC